MLWLAFNAIYGGEPDSGERGRIVMTIRSYISPIRARGLLERIHVAAERILAVAPGDMLTNRWDLRFRLANRWLAWRYRTGPTPVSRLAALAGVLYQVRCVLIQGSHDRQEERDRMLVRESLQILETLVPELPETLQR